MSVLLDELIQMENRAEDLRKEIIDKISTSIETVPLDGVTVLNSAPRAVSVNLSAVMSGPCILAPGYYIPEAQAEAIRRKLSNYHTTEGLCNALAEIIETKKVRFSHSMQDDAVVLNEQTLKILRETELGKYVAARSQMR